MFALNAAVNGMHVRFGFDSINLLHLIVGCALFAAYSYFLVASMAEQYILPIG